MAFTILDFGFWILDSWPHDFGFWIHGLIGRGFARDFGLYITTVQNLTMGQLQLYQWALEAQEPERQLFLAVSQAIYLRHFEKPIFQLAVKRNKINLLIYKPDQEVILQWIIHKIT